MQVSKKSALALIQSAAGRRVLVLSPHFDDAAFSLSGLIAALTERCCRVIVVTVFSAGAPSPTGFALRCQTDKGIPAEIDYMELRATEDQNALGILKAERQELGLLEAPHRGYGSPESLFGPLRHEDVTIVGQLAQTLREMVQCLDPCWIVSPAGLGEHVDHRLVRTAAERAVSHRRLLLYLEAPYLIRRPRVEVERCAHGSIVHLNEVASRRSLRKEVYCAYASQLRYQLRGLGGASAATRRIARQASMLAGQHGEAELLLRPFLPAWPNQPIT